MNANLEWAGITDSVIDICDKYNAEKVKREIEEGYKFPTHEPDPLRYKKFTSPMKKA